MFIQIEANAVVLVVVCVSVLYYDRVASPSNFWIEFDLIVLLEEDRLNDVEVIDAHGRLRFIKVRLEY